MVSTTDFFYPLIESPLIMGAIAAANVMSDVYAMGIVHIDSMLMILAASSDMPPEMRARVTRLFIEGFSSHCVLADTVLSGGQSVMNPWPIIGGTASTVVPNAQVLIPTVAQPGDVLILTKPLGVQIATNLKQWSHDPAGEKWQKLLSKHAITRQELLYIYHRAIASMLRLNRHAASLFKVCQVHAATDVTGFGILGHASQTAALQIEAVDFVIDTLPCIAGTIKVNDAMSMRLRVGTSAETSGGILLALPESQVANFMSEIQRLDGEPAWVIGKVIAGNRSARIVEAVQIIEV